jgi:hypothetical protein
MVYNFTIVLEWLLLQGSFQRLHLVEHVKVQKNKKTKNDSLHRENRSSEIQISTRIKYET